MRNRFADGGSLGGTEIGGLDPLTLAWRFWATFRTANFGPPITPRIARWFGGTRRLRRFAGFRDGFGLGPFLRSGFMRGKFGGRFRVRFAKVTGGIGIWFRGFGVFRRFGCRSGGFNGFGGRRNFFRVRRTGFCRFRTRTAATTATATAATIAAGTARRGRI